MAGKKQSVEIVVPIYNEEFELEENITKLDSFLTKNLKKYLWRITIADNASTDDSLKIAKILKDRLEHVDVIHLDKKGRGRAVKRAWERSKADFLVYMDVDLSTDLKSLPKLIASLNDGYDIAIGSRLIKEARVYGRPWKREILSRGYNILIKLFFGTNFSDAQCGFKAVTKRIVKKLLPYVLDDAWFFDSEMLILGEKMGYKIYEEPVFWIDNPGSTVRVLRTVTGDIKGLLRLFFTRPWAGQKIYER